MKVAINCLPVSGPWGGGNRFILALSAALKSRGDVVVHDLGQPDIDIALIVDPRRRNPQMAFAPIDALDYVAKVRPEAIVVHRINECDERKGTRTMNFRLRLANYCADHTVFVASWLRELDVWLKETRSTVILGGADPSIFVRDSAARWDGSGKLSLVTHHWGSHPYKGHDIHMLLDRMLSLPEWKDRISFTYIGNWNRTWNAENIRVIEPLDGRELADELARHHAYVTASIGEPSGNHHMEAAMIGLPILYRLSGGLPEYCKGFGVGFNGPTDFPAAVERLIASYPELKQAMPGYPYTSSRMLREFLDLFDSLVARRSEIAAHRRAWRNPLKNIANRLPF